MDEPTDKEKVIAAYWQAKRDGDDNPKIDILALGQGPLSQWLAIGYIESLGEPNGAEPIEEKKEKIADFRDSDFIGPLKLEQAHLKEALNGAGQKDREIVERLYEMQEKAKAQGEYLYLQYLDTAIRRMNSNGEFSENFNTADDYMNRLSEVFWQQIEREQSDRAVRTAIMAFMWGSSTNWGHGYPQNIPEEEFNGFNFDGAGKSLKPQNLMDDLANSGVKYSADDVVTVTKTPDGKLMWLEKGNNSAGLKHIVDGHATDFANRGITDIPDFLNRVLQETPIKTGVGKMGPFAEYMLDGKTYRIAHGTNGYIVSFFPRD